VRFCRRRMSGRLNRTLRISVGMCWGGTRTEMDHVDTDRLAACPSCGAPMRFSRTVPAISGLPEMQTFECRPCRLAVTAEQVLQFPEFAEAKPLSV
jgi:hypothetical protein